MGLLRTRGEKIGHPLLWGWGGTCYAPEIYVQKTSSSSFDWSSSQCFHPAAVNSTVRTTEIYTASRHV